MRTGLLVVVLAGSGCASQVELSDLNVGASVIVPSAANFPANGLTRAEVTLQLARNDGTPLSGLSVRLASEHCTVVQPTMPTDAAGRVQGAVTCVRPAVELITASVLFNGAAAALPQTTQLNFFAPGDGHLGVAAGTPLAAQVVATAADSQGKGVDIGYVGTVVFSSTDPLATLPPPYTITVTDRGFHSWNRGLVWRTVGEQVLSATDKASGRLMYSETYTVVPSPAQGIRVVPNGGAAEAGRNLGVTVAVVDALGNVIPTYTGTVQLFSSDPLAHLRRAGRKNGSIIGIEQSRRRQLRQCGPCAPPRGASNQGSSRLLSRSIARAKAGGRPINLETRREKTFGTIPR